MGVESRAVVKQPLPQRTLNLKAHSGWKHPGAPAPAFSSRKISASEISTFGNSAFRGSGEALKVSQEAFAVEAILWSVGIGAI